MGGFLERALALAGGAQGRAYPKPTVGAVVVGPDGTIAGEGATEPGQAGRHAERLARAQQQAELAAFTQASQSVYERCLAERRVDCDSYGATLPYAGPIAVVPVRHRRPVLVRTSFTGRSAGNVVGPGIMPGTFNGPNAITAGNFTFR